jgi:hypothetical protein
LLDVRRDDGLPLWLGKLNTKETAMSTNFLPTRDALLLDWSSNFNTKITASPTTYGLTAAQATAYGTLNTAFSSAYTTATAPSTRTRGTVAAKNAARATLKANARLLARIVQATASVTAQQKIDLGLTPRDVIPSPINPPTEAPVIEIVAALGRTIKLNLRTVGSDRRGKPNGVQGASLFSFVGAAAPADLSDWMFEGSTTRTSFDVEFAPTIPAGSQVWLTAFWFNPRSQSGPACTPINAYIAGGVALAA